MKTILNDRGYRSTFAGSEKATTATLYLYDFIGADLFGDGITAKRVIEDLAEIGQVETLDVRINSPGGDVFDGIAIHNALARFPAQVVVHIDGLAASAASLIAMAGDKILAAENSELMVHRPWTIAIGDGPEMRRTADQLDKAWSSILTTYADRTHRRAPKIEQLIDAAGGELWMTAEEAVKEGFADGTEKPAKEAKMFGLSQFRAVPERLAAVAAADPMRERFAARRLETDCVRRAAAAVDAESARARAAARRRRIAAAARATT
jgi:ATP-dependent protease ClpP protease subunit